MPLGVATPVTLAHAPDKPAEELRLSTSTFRNGLKKRGLTDVLELHLKDFPPSTETARLQNQLGVEQSRNQDTSVPTAERRAALSRANALRGEMIAANPEDRRRFDWRFELAHSLIYEEAEPYFSCILYRGGSAADRRELRARTKQALSVLREFNADLEAEYERIDDLPIREFEGLEQSGYIDALDRIAPKAEYLLAWTLLFDALARDASDTQRPAVLTRLVQLVGENSPILNTPHARSKVQVQAQLLVGMANRLQQRYDEARDHLQRAVATFWRIDDEAERMRIRWASHLALIEQVRNERDARRMDKALKALERFRRTIDSDHASSAGLALVAALLERSTYKAMARSERQGGNTLAAAQYDITSWQALQRLVAQSPHRRSEVYAAVFDLVGSRPDEDLDAFERCAVVAGLLMDADLSEDQRQDRLDRAIQLGQSFERAAPPEAKSLVPEVGYNVAVAMYRRGRIVDAARKFLQVARDHRAFAHGLRAAEYAVQLASSVARDPNNRGRDDARLLYREALKTLVEGFPDSDIAGYWRFFYAQALEDDGAYTQAAELYNAIEKDHEHFLQSLLFRMRCLARLLEESGTISPAKSALWKRSFLESNDELDDTLSARLSEGPSAAMQEELKRWQALATLIDAEFRILPAVGEAEEALQALQSFMEDFPAEEALFGRVWRVRLRAHERLGQIDEACDAIRRYVNADEQHFAATFQDLYNDLSEQVHKLRDQGQDNQAKKEAKNKAEIALELAEALFEHAEAKESPDVLALRTQLALALVEAGKPLQALERFKQLGLGSDSTLENMQGGANPGVLFGIARALYAQEKFGEALPLFNELATRIEPAKELRWRALLYDLQCRHHLGQTPSAIIKVIQQQEFLYPDMGGPTMRAAFEELQRESQRRLPGG